MSKASCIKACMKKKGYGKLTWAGILAAIVIIGALLASGVGLAIAAIIGAALGIGGSFLSAWVSCWNQC